MMLEDVGKRCHITKSLQSQYVIGLHRDENLTKKPISPQYRVPTGFLYPLKTSKNSKVMFSGGRERVYWERIC